MGKLPYLNYSSSATQKVINGWTGINYRPGAADGELTSCHNMSASQYPYLSPRKGRRLAAEYTRPSALFAWDDLIVVDGTDLLYGGEKVGTVEAGEKQFAVVNSKLIIWPDKCILDLQNNAFSHMDVSVKSSPSSVSFTGSSISFSNKTSQIGQAEEDFPYNNDAPQMVYKYDSVSWTGDTWVKSGEQEVDIKTLESGDVLIPSKSQQGAYSLNVKPQGGEYQEENQDGVYITIKSVSQVGTTESQWQKWNVVKSSRTYYTQGEFQGPATGDVGSQTFTGYTSYTFRASTGEYTGTGSQKTISASAPGTVYFRFENNFPQSSSVARITITGTGESAQWALYVSSSDGPFTSTSYSKGATFYGYVYGEKGLYPDNGRKDGYWYVYMQDTSFNGTISISYEISSDSNPRLELFFLPGDIVDISGCVTRPGNNLEKLKIVSVEEDTLNFAENTFDIPSTGAGYDEAGEVTISRPIPDMDYICASGNRLWGVTNSQTNEVWNAETKTYETVSARVIWASALGNPYNFYDYDGLSTDSYAVAVGTQSDFTGIIDYSGSVLCWKEDLLHRITGDYPANFYMYTDSIAGVQAGSHKSMAIINDVLYYKGRDGIYVYAGGQPELISYKLGDGYYDAAVAGAIDTRYYISMRDGQGDPSLFVYDTIKGTWYREDELEIISFATLGGVIYALAGTYLFALEADAGSDGDTLQWEATLAQWTEDSFTKKQYRWLRIFADIAQGATLNADISIDGSERHNHFSSGRPGVTSFEIPLHNMRCDRATLFLYGSGRVTIKRIAADIIFGSEEK